MKEKIKQYWKTILAFFVGIGVAIGAVLIAMFRSKEGTLDIKDDAIKIKKKENGTQKLPETPDLDKELKKINKSINS